METNKAIDAIYGELDWLAKVIDQVFRSYFKLEGHEKNWLDIPMQELTAEDGYFGELVSNWDLTVFDRLALALAMAPHFRPELLDVFFTKNATYERVFTEFGGTGNKNESVFLPTGQTYIFLVTAANSSLRTEAMNAIGKNGILVREEVLVPGAVDAGVPELNGVLGMGAWCVHTFLTGAKPEIEYSADFPAQKMTTPLEWEDLVLDTQVKEQVLEINAWAEHSDTIMNAWGLAKRIKPCYRVLFYGAPGTGKTLTALLLGKSAGREVYRVDLSILLSKYIGETEQNLSRIFETAKRRNWILFFDDVDSLFGKRADTNQANDRYTEQQRAYILQRLEDYPELVILETNLRNNMDEAFLRRFELAVHFAVPSAAERLMLWKNAFSGTCTLHADIDVKKIAEDYALSGGSIVNVLRNCALAAIRRNDTVVTKAELLTAIKKELRLEVHGLES